MWTYTWHVWTNTTQNNENYKTFYAIGPRHEKTCLRGFANYKGVDQPVQMGSLISAFVIRFQENIIKNLLPVKFQFSS